MGASHPGELSSESLNRFLSNYNFLKEQNDSRFGIIKIYRHKIENDEIMISNKFFTTEKEFNVFQKEIRNRSLLEHATLLKIIGYSKSTNAAICGEARNFSIYSEYCPHNLKKEIQKRSLTSEYFTEPELWFIAETCLCLGKFYQNRNMYHGDFRPINIMLTEEGLVKFSDVFLLSSLRNGYSKTLSQEARCYLSPDQMSAFSRKEQYPLINEYKSDVFSLGITLLYASNFLRPNTNYYDWMNLRVNERAIQDSLRDLSLRYSSSWKELLESMLNITECYRPDFCSLYPLSYSKNEESTGAKTSSEINPAQPQLPQVYNSTVVSPQQQIYAQTNTYQSPQKVIQQASLYNSEVQNSLYKVNTLLGNPNAGQIVGNSANKSQSTQINAFQPTNSYFPASNSNASASNSKIPPQYLYSSNMSQSQHYSRDQLAPVNANSYQIGNSNLQNFQIPSYQNPNEKSNQNAYASYRNNNNNNNNNNQNFQTGSNQQNYAGNGYQENATALNPNYYR